jgi:hypothetical protein
MLLVRKVRRGSCSIHISANFVHGFAIEVVVDVKAAMGFCGEPVVQVVNVVQDLVAFVNAMDFGMDSDCDDVQALIWWQLCR